MIRHIVAVRFEQTVSMDTKAALFAELEELRHLVDGVLDFHVGANVSPETAVVHGYLDAFWFDFADARDAYLVHPAHQAIGAKLVASVQGGTDGIVVVDLKV